MFELQPGLYQNEIIEKDQVFIIFSASSISLSCCMLWTVTAVNDKEILEIGIVQVYKAERLWHNAAIPL